MNTNIHRITVLYLVLLLFNTPTIAQDEKSDFQWRCPKSREIVIASFRQSSGGLIVGFVDGEVSTIERSNGTSVTKLFQSNVIATKRAKAIDLGTKLIVADHDGVDIWDYEKARLDRQSLEEGWKVGCISRGIADSDYFVATYDRDESVVSRQSFDADSVKTEELLRYGRHGTFSDSAKLTNWISNIVFSSDHASFLAEFECGYLLKRKKEPELQGPYLHGKECKVIAILDHSAGLLLADRHSLSIIENPGGEKAKIKVDFSRSRVADTALSPNRKLCAVATFNGESQRSSIHFFDPSSLRLVKFLEPEIGFVTDLSWSEDSTQVIFISGAKTINVLRVPE